MLLAGVLFRLALQQQRLAGTSQHDPVCPSNIRAQFKPRYELHIILTCVMSTVIRFLACSFRHGGFNSIWLMCKRSGRLRAALLTGDPVCYHSIHSIDAVSQQHVAAERVFLENFIVLRHKAAGARNWPLISVKRRALESSDLYRNVA
jgi:hypothetical protein